MPATQEETTMKRHPKYAIVRPALAAAAAALALGAGCGGDGDRLSTDETAKELNAAVRTVNGEFQQVFQLLGSREEHERVPSAVRARLEEAATVERRQADEFDTIEPPADSEAAIESFARVARRQAAMLERAATRENLTVAEMADVIELPEMRDAVAELDRQGLVNAPPAHQ
jgi:hypothetical protein